MRWWREVLEEGTEGVDGVCGLGEWPVVGLQLRTVLGLMDVRATLRRSTPSFKSNCILIMASFPFY